MNSIFKRQINGRQIDDSVLAQIFMNLLPTDFDSQPYLSFPYDEKTYEVLLGSICHRWRDVLSNSANLWKRVNLSIPTHKPLKSDFFSMLHRMAPYIERLNVNGFVGDIFTRVFLNFPTFPNVTSLQFNVGPHLTPMEWALVVELCPNVEKFSNDYERQRHLNDTTLQLFATGWPNLVDIDIVNCHKLTGAGLIDFVTIANRLQSIDINYIPHVTDPDIGEITRLLSKSLKSISFGRNQNDLSELAIQSIAQNCPNLEKIFLKKPKFNVGHLKNLTNLKSLTIGFPESMSSANTKELEEIFCRPFGQLRVLAIYNFTNVTDSFLTQIADRCPILEELNLATLRDYTNRLVTDSGLDQIVNKCRNLTRLNLSGFPLVTGSSLIGSRGKLPNLRFISLSKDLLVADAIKAEFAGIYGMEIHLWGSGV